MSSTQKKINAYIFIDYIPAELRENTTWEVVYYAKNPITEKLQIKRNRVKPILPITSRRKLGKQMVSNINKKLESGWNPFINAKTNIGFTKFFAVKELYLKHAKFQIKRGEKRPDTYRTYKSFLKNIEDYLNENDKTEMFILDFNEDFINEFLDHIYYDRENSARTRNNYLRFISTFCGWLLNKKYIGNNITARIEPLREAEKTRINIDNKDIDRIFDYLLIHNRPYALICMICYYCHVRRTEMTKIQVKDFVLDNNILYVENVNSKNRKSLPVTIPRKIIPFINQHIYNSRQHDFVFSETLRPGTMQLKPKKISDLWSDLRNKLNFPKQYQWYSLKDTGITNLLRAGVPLINVRDQARHHSSAQTDAYTPKEILKANQNIMNADI